MDVLGFYVTVSKGVFECSVARVPSDVCFCSEAFTGV